MFRERIPSAQLSAWLFAGMTPVLIQLLSGSSWVWIAVAGAVGLLIAACVWRLGWQPNRWQAPFLLIYTIIVIGSVLHQCDESWPVGNSYPAVPLIVLALAAWSAQKGPSAAARVGAVLFWIVLIMYLVVFGAGVKDVHLRWLKPRWDAPDAIGLLIFLVPSAAVCLRHPDVKWSVRLTLPVVFVVAAAIITVGVLSAPVAMRLENAFYEMSRSVSLGGVARRFEALISAGMTVGWFALLSLLLSICGLCVQRFFAGWGRTGVWLSTLASGGWMLCGLHIPGWILLLGGALFWVLMPILTQGLGRIKKSKKSENNA